MLRMNRLHIPQERMVNRLGVKQQTISIHLQKMPELAKLVNTDLSKGFTVSQVAEKHGWVEPLMWSIALRGKSDLDRFKALNLGLRTWDLWNWNDCLPREIHVNDSEAYFTGVTDVSVMSGPVASPISQIKPIPPQFFLRPSFVIRLFPSSIIVRGFVI